MLLYVYKVNYCFSKAMISLTLTEMILEFMNDLLGIILQ